MQHGTFNKNAHNLHIQRHLDINLREHRTIKRVMLSNISWRKWFKILVEDSLRQLLVPICVSYRARTIKWSVANVSFSIFKKRNTLRIVGTVLYYRGLFRTYITHRQTLGIMICSSYKYS